MNTIPKTKVLFLCTGNSDRRQMAEALLRAYAGDRYEAFSTVLETQEINPYTIKVLEEIEIDTSQHYSKPLTTYLRKVHFGYLIIVCGSAEKNCPVFPGMGQRIHWPLEDPAAFEGSPEETLGSFGKFGVKSTGTLGNGWTNRKPFMREHYAANSEIVRGNQKHPRGVRWAHLSVRSYNGKVVDGQDPMGQHQYWFAAILLTNLDEGSDRWVLENEMVSLTPLRLDLTDENWLHQIQRQPEMMRYG